MQHAYLALSSDREIQCLQGFVSHISSGFSSVKEKESWIYRFVQTVYIAEIERRKSIWFVRLMDWSMDRDIVVLSIFGYEE